MAVFTVTLSPGSSAPSARASHSRCIWFRPLFAFFVIDVNTKQVIHVAVTRETTERWTAHQLREATPFGAAPEFIIRDRDAKFGADFDRVAKGSEIRVLRTAISAPLMNATCERFVGSVRREHLVHVIVLGERHLPTVLAEYAAYFIPLGLIRGLSNAFRFRPRLSAPAPTDQSSCFLSSDGSIMTIAALPKRADDKSSQHSLDKLCCSN